MNLDPTLTLLATLAGAVSANQPEVHVDYTVYNRSGETAKPVPFRVALNSTSDVTILAAPPQEYAYVVDGVSIHNKDTASVTVLVKTTDGSTQRIRERVILATLETLHYENGVGWYVMTANGAIKQSSGISGPASSTNNAMVRWNGTTGTIVQDTSDITYDGTTYIIGSSKFTVASASGNTLVGGNLTVSGTGPHAIGGATNSSIQLYLTGSFSGASSAVGVQYDGTLTPAAGNVAYGEYVAPTLQKAGSGTHSDFASLVVVAPSIGAGAATLTNSTSLKITGAPSVGTNKYSFWVAAGDIRLDTTTQSTIGANGAASALTANPVGYLAFYIGTTKFIIPYYNS